MDRDLKNWPLFSSLELISPESRQKLNTNGSLCHIIFRIIPATRQECYAYELEYKF